MDEDEARTLAEDRLRQLQQLSYHQLREHEKEHREVVADSGTSYQLVTYVVHDDQRRDHLRVCVAVDFGWRVFWPLISAFSIGPDGSFIGESSL